MLSMPVAFRVARGGKCGGRWNWLGDDRSCEGGIRVGRGERMYVIVVVIVTVGSLFEVVSGPREFLSFVLSHDASNSISDLFGGMGSMC